MKNIDHWLDGKSKRFQSAKFSQEVIKEEYEKYLNESSNGSSSSQESNISIKQWKALPKSTVRAKKTEKEKEKVIEDLKPTNAYFSVPSFHNIIQTNYQGPKQPWGPNFFH